MIEQERADLLARAVDHLIHPNRNPPPPPSRTDRDLDALVDVAASRATVGNMLRIAAASSRDGVWRSVADRLGSQAQAPARAGELSDADAAELAGVITVRRGISEHVMSYARRQQAEAWSVVTARLKAAGMALETEPARRNRPEAGTPGRRVRNHHSLVAERPVVARPAAGEPHGQSPVLPTRRRKLPERGIAGILAATALFIAAIGPLPATGLADHPAAVAVRGVRSHLGVGETHTAPPDPISGEAAAAEDVSLEEARRLTGLPVLEPGDLPEGFTLEASRYFDDPLSAGDGGVFVLSYRDADSSAIDILQEEASGADLAVPAGAAVDTFAGGYPATYVTGEWSDAAGSLVWEPGGSQTVIFDAEGVRTTIRYAGPPVSPQELLNVAGDLAGQRTR